MKLLERTGSLAALTALWRRAKTGQGAVALVVGEAGIGKTSVIRAFVAEVDGRSAIGACDAMSTPRPHGPLADIAPQLSPALVRALGAGEPVFAALLAALQTPTVLIIEDAHWADAATLDLIRYLARRIASLPVLLVATYRDDEVGPRHPLRVVLGDIATAAVTRIALERLSADAVAALAKGSGLDARALYKRTSGNAFFVTEAIAARSLEVPAHVRDVVIARYARLDDLARAAVELAAVLNLDTAALPPAIADAAVGSGLIERRGGAIAFRHELGREAVLSAIAPARRRACHAEALALLTGRADAAALAHHAEGAGDAALTHTYALAAAARAARLKSHREAAAQYARAARNADEDPALLEAWAYESYLTGEPAAAVEQQLRAAAIWKQRGDRLRYGDNLRWLSRLSWYAGRRADADRYAAEAIAVLAKLPPGRELAFAYSNQSQLHALSYDGERAVAFGKKAIALARKARAEDIECHALNNVGMGKLNAGDRRGAVDLEKSLAIALRLAHEEHAARAYTNLSSSLLSRHEIAPALRWFREGIAYCEEHDLDAWRLYMLGQRAMAELHAGELAAALETAHETLARPIAPPSRVHPLCVLGRARARRGDPEVWAPLDEALAIAAPMDELQRMGPVRIARAEAAFLAGDLARAKQEASAIATKDGWLGGELAMWLQLAGGKARAATWMAAPYAKHVRREHAAAAKLWRAHGQPFEEALALAGTGDEANLRAAFALVEARGMTAVGAWIAERLRALGARHVPRGRRASTRANVAGLTGREVEVLDCLVDGLRNAQIGKRLFISAKTVDHHVSAILRKLDLPDRAAAARWRRERAPAE